MLPLDLSSFTFVSDPRLHPDGSRIAFVTSRMDLDEDRYERRIHLWDGAGHRPFTSGKADASPRWSPDGSMLAFLRSVDDQPPQLALMPTDGGEAEIVTDFELGVSEAEWSPDGSTIAVVATDYVDEWRDMDDEERARHPRRITRPAYRWDNRGWRHDRRSALHLVDVADRTVRRLTRPDHDEGGIAWSPDGTELAFVSARHPEWGFDPGNQVFRIKVSDGPVEAVTEVGSWSTLSYRPDGALTAVGNPDRWDFPSVPKLYRIDGDQPEVLFDVDRNLSPYNPPISPSGPQWLDDGTAIAVLEDSARLDVIRIDGAEVTPIIQERMLVTGVSPRRDGSAFAFVATTATDPGNLWWWEDGETRRLTDLNAGLSLVEPSHFTFERDGAEIDVWVFLPEGDHEVPVLLNIHGGPATQYGWGFFDEFQMYVAAGYGVVACNPRGSSGKGTEFVRGPVERWTEERPPDLEDIVTALNQAMARYGRLDPLRLGIMGGSYGGLMTTRILAVENRFRSAVPERGLYSFTSFTGTSDIGLWFGGCYLGPKAGWEERWAASPLARADRITTPCLIIHSEADHRCPIEQAEQLFSALVSNGTHAELLRFPGESHELSRGGKPRHRVERFEAILDWHAQHLGAPDVTT